MDEVKVLVSRNFPDIGILNMRKQGFEVTTWDEERPMEQWELIEKARSHHALFCAGTDKIDKHFLNECRHLKIISQFAVGLDNIDIPEASRLGIAIGYTPGAMSKATADVAFGLMIAVSRKMFHTHKSILNGEWKYFKPKANLGIELRGKTLGVFGMGRIGMEMAKLCKGAYNMEVIYHNRNRNPLAEQSAGARWVSFDELLQKSDVLSVHCSLTTETRGIFNKSVFDRMKPDAIFINTARGGIHNEDDLFEALIQGTIWGAGLDVTNPEPMRADHPLLSLENACILPHIGSATVETRDLMSKMAAENIIGFFTKGKVPNIANPEVLNRA